MGKGLIKGEKRQPPTWLALHRKADAIRAELAEEDFAATVLQGALQVGQSSNPIRGNLCAAALRELAGHVLHSLAPNARVLDCCWYKPEPNTNGPTRQQRATYIVQGGLPIDFVEQSLNLDHTAVCRPLIKAMDELNRATHVREETILSNDRDIRALADTAINSLLHLFEATWACQQEVHRHLADEIDDAVFDGFLSETLQELDELSTHTTFDEHHLDEIRVLSIDNKWIELIVKGKVYVELQYGSNSDLRNDIGAVMSDSYPFSGRMKSKARSPRELDKQTVELSVDTSSFYE